MITTRMCAYVIRYALHCILQDPSHAYTLYFIPYTLYLILQDPSHAYTLYFILYTLYLILQDPSHAYNENIYGHDSYPYKKICAQLLTKLEAVSKEEANGAHSFRRVLKKAKGVSTTASK